MLEALIDEPDFEWLMIDVGYVKVHAHGTGAVRLNNGWKEQISLRVLDSQSVKNTNSAESNGYDAAREYQASNDTSQWTLRGPHMLST